tara:strand:- start:866 stop:1021 length:156 start_codon:yes stop_codon:yes gene_type:complete
MIRINTLDDLRQEDFDRFSKPNRTKKKKRDGEKKKKQKLNQDKYENFQGQQ